MLYLPIPREKFIVDLSVHLWRRHLHLLRTRGNTGHETNMRCHGGLGGSVEGTGESVLSAEGGTEGGAVGLCVGKHGYTEHICDDLHERAG